MVSYSSRSEKPAPRRIPASSATSFRTRPEYPPFTTNLAQVGRRTLFARGCLASAPPCQIRVRSRRQATASGDDDARSERLVSTPPTTRGPSGPPRRRICKLGVADSVSACPTEAPTRTGRFVQSMRRRAGLGAGLESENWSICRVVRSQVRPFRDRWLQGTRMNAGVTPAIGAEVAVPCAPVRPSGFARRGRRRRRRRPVGERRSSSRPIPCAKAKGRVLAQATATRLWRPDRRSG
jgi:hypothetical protein